MATKYVDEFSVKEEAQARWREDAGVRGEFGEFSTYLAFRNAEARGLVKISGRSHIRHHRPVTQDSAQRLHGEDQNKLTKWVQQTLRQIRAEHGAPLPDAKPHKVQTLDGPRRLSDGDLLGMIRSEKEAAEYWEISPALQDEFPSSASLWHFVKGKREGAVKILSQQGGPEGPRSTGAKPHTVLEFIGPDPSSGLKMFKAVTCQEDA